MASTVWVGVATAVSSDSRTVIPVPRTIDPTGGADVTVALNTFLAAVPERSTIVFPVNARYRIEGTARLENKTDVVVQGQGSTFFATTDGLGQLPPSCGAYPGASVCLYPNRTRAHWAFVNDRNIFVRNVNVIGSARNTGPNGAYTASLEAQHAFTILASTGVVLDHVSGRDVWGDFVYVGVALVPSRGYVASSYVFVVNSTFRGSSRQGWTVTSGQHVVFYNNSIDQVRRSLIDIEANTAKDVIAYIAIKNNWLGHSRFCTFSNHGAAAIEHDFLIADNHLIGNTKFRICVKAAPTARRSNYVISGNVGSTLRPNEPMVGLEYVDNVIVKGNVQGFSLNAWPWRPGPNGSPQSPVQALCSSVVVDANTFPRPAGKPELSSRPC